MPRIHGEARDVSLSTSPRLWHQDRWRYQSKEGRIWAPWETSFQNSPRGATTFHSTFYYYYYLFLCFVMIRRRFIYSFYGTVTGKRGNWGNCIGDLRPAPCGSRCHYGGIRRGGASYCLHHWGNTTARHGQGQKAITRTKQIEINWPELSRNHRSRTGTFIFLVFIKNIFSCFMTQKKMFNILFSI